MSLASKVKRLLDPEKKRKRRPKSKKKTTRKRTPPRGKNGRFKKRR